MYVNTYAHINWYKLILERGEQLIDPEKNDFHHKLNIFGFATVDNVILSSENYL